MTFYTAREVVQLWIVPAMEARDYLFKDSRNLVCTDPELDHIWCGMKANVLFVGAEINEREGPECNCGAVGPDGTFKTGNGKSNHSNYCSVWE